MQEKRICLNSLFLLFSKGFSHFFAMLKMEFLVRWMGVTNHGLVNDKGQSFQH